MEMHWTAGCDDDVDVNHVKLCLGGREVAWREVAWHGVS